VSEAVLGSSACLDPLPQASSHMEPASACLSIPPPHTCLGAPLLPPSCSCSSACMLCLPRIRKMVHAGERITIVRPEPRLASLHPLHLQLFRLVPPPWISVCRQGSPCWSAYRPPGFVLQASITCFLSGSALSCRPWPLFALTASGLTTGARITEAQLRATSHLNRGVFVFLS
jgi:hypothetical protein